MKRSMAENLPCCVLLLRIKAIVYPGGRIGINVFPYHLEIAFGADNVIVKALLPYCSAELLCDNSSQLLNNVGYRRGEHCSPVFIASNTQQQMNMVRHDHVFLNNIHGIVDLDAGDGLFNNDTMMR